MEERLERFVEHDRDAVDKARREAIHAEWMATYYPRVDYMDALDLTPAVTVG